LDDEVSRAESEEKRIEGSLNVEISARIDADTGLQRQITENNNKRIEAEGDLKSKDWTSKVNYSEEVNKTDLATTIYTEHKRAVKSEGNLSDLESLFSANTGKVSKEAAKA
jgi:hypothetical protein